MPESGSGPESQEMKQDWVEYKSLNHPVHRQSDNLYANAGWGSSGAFWGHCGCAPSRTRAHACRQRHSWPPWQCSLVLGGVYIPEQSIGAVRFNRARRKWKVWIERRGRNRDQVATQESSLLIFTRCAGGARWSSPGLTTEGIKNKLWSSTKGTTGTGTLESPVLPDRLNRRPSSVSPLSARTQLALGLHLSPCCPLTGLHKPWHIIRSLSTE